MTPEQEPVVNSVLSHIPVRANAYGNQGYYSSELYKAILLAKPNWFSPNMKGGFVSNGVRLKVLPAAQQIYDVIALELSHQLQIVKDPITGNNNLYYMFNDEGKRRVAEVRRSLAAMRHPTSDLGSALTPSRTGESHPVPAPVSQAGRRGQFQQR